MLKRPPSKTDTLATEPLEQPRRSGCFETAMPVEWHLVEGAQLYEGRLPTLTTRNLKAESLYGVLPIKGDKLMLAVSGFPEPIPFKCVGIAASKDAEPVMRIELEIG